MTTAAPCLPFRRLRLSMRNLSQWLARLREDLRGFATAELALTFPIVLLILLGGLEGAMYVVAQQKVSRVANALADLAAQSESGALESQISDLFESARFITDPADIIQDGRMYVTAVRGGGAGVGNSILWQRCDGLRSSTISALGTSDNRNVPLPGALLLADTDIVLVGEASMEYQPLFFNVVFTQSMISHTAMARPRNLDFSTITPDGTIPKSNCGTVVTQY